MLGKLSLAVVEPTYPVNIGHLARLVRNFGLHSLILIEPSFNIDEALPYASHGADILRAAKVMSLKELFEHFELVVGTTSIPGGSRNIKRDVVTPEAAAKRISESSGSICILLGRESTGLTNKELELCDLVISIPTGTAYRTLNISHAAAIILYTISRTHTRGVKKVEVPRSMKRLLLDSAVELANLAGFPKYKVEMLRASLKMLVSRGNPTHRELSLILGLFRKAILALNRRSQLPTFSNT
ncbi:MAG: RNA methyltransferase [Nitrososphaerales archaeon]